MKYTLLIVCLLTTVVVTAQNSKENWNLNLHWPTSATADSINFLQIELDNVWKPDSMQNIKLKITDMSGVSVLDSVIIVTPSCFTGQSNSCLISLRDIKSGFYKYRATILYKDSTETPERIIDHTNRGNR